MRKKKEMTYHYAGKVHVRGLLRRVWRPRYLALGDDGYLRYHESIPPLIQQDLQLKQPHNPYSLSISHSAHDSYSNMYRLGLHNTHRPKNILAILDGARTIDPNSVVDQHVALPQGVYGFVFRGRPVELYTTAGADTAVASNSDADQQGALIVPPAGYNSADAPGKQSKDTSITNSPAQKHSTKAAVVNLVFPRGTSRRRTAQKMAKKAINPDICGFGRTNHCDGGISRSSSSSSLMGYEQPLLEQETSRDNYNDNAGHGWGRDSHESQDTIGSFQEVERSHVSRDLNDSAAHHTTHRKEKAQNTPTKSTVQVQVQASSVQSREYLCAVSTAEEAESWVVALRWAAEHRRRIRYGNSTTRRIEDINNDATIPSATTPSKIMISDEQINPVIDQDDDRGIDDFGNDSEGHQSRSTSKRSSSDTSEGNSGTESSTQKYTGSDSKASLTSLLIEQDGWCKAETEKKKKAEDNEETWIASEASLNKGGTSGPLPLSESNDHTQASAEMLPREDKSIPLAQTESPSSASFSKKRPSSPGCATIVVTKVSTFRLPRTRLVGTDHRDKVIPWVPFHFPLPGDDLVLEYEIQLLLLRNCKPRTELSVRPESIEERTIFKSVSDVLSLVRDLMTEFDTEKHVNLSVEGGESDPPTPQRKGRAIPTLQTDDTLRLLEDIESTLLSCLNSSVKHGSAESKSISTMPSELSSSMSEAISSVGKIDNVMRKLSKDSNICASRHFQQFLCLHASHDQSYSLSTTSKDRATPTIGVSREADAEQVVRKWLAQIDRPPAMTKLQLILAIILRHRLGGPALSLVSIWSTTRLASILWSMVSGTRIVISIPFETYATLVTLSFFFGHNNGVSVRSRDRVEKLGNQSKKGHHIRSPMSIGESMGDKFSEETMPADDDDHSTVAEEGGSESDSEIFIAESPVLSSPLPLFPANHGITCWSEPDHNIFMVRGTHYLEDRIKIPSASAVFHCRGVDVWITDNAERNISRHPSVLGGKLDQEDTFVVNFLLPFSNFVAYFTVPPIEEMPANIADVWSKFIKGDQQYRDRKLKLLPVVVEGPWIVKKAVGPGTSPAVIGRDLPLQYYFTEPTASKKGVYEVDVLVTASRIARGILNVVKGHTKSLTIAFAFIIEASEHAQLPETVLCAFQVHSLHLEDCPNLPDCYPDG
ncbi:hypothetical protein ACHAXR_011974 [Thalassiosira sp. AJA248-18]